MKQSAFCRIWRLSLVSLFIDPLVYAASVISVVIPALRFFLLFFTVSASCDLRPFFVTIPFVSVAIIPLLAFRLRRFIHEDSLPAASFTKFAAVTASCVTAFLLPLVLLLALPLCVQSFGDIEPGQLIAGYAGLFLYTGAASALCICFFAAFSAPAVSLLVSALVLLLVNCAHFLFYYVRTGGLVSFLVQSVSFFWHFDAAGKGIFDTRDIFFYVFAIFFFLLLATLAENRRIGRRIERLPAVLCCIILVFGGIASNRLYLRADVTAAKRFTVSKQSRAVCALLEEPLRLTYYRSPELSTLYPQTNDVAEYLASYAQQSHRISLELKKAGTREISLLQSLGIQGTQIRSTKSARVEYTTVYSAVVMHYLDTELILPLVLSTQTLEYDLTRRVQELVTGRTRDVYVISGNGLPLSAGAEEGYGYVFPYLERMGFMPHAVAADSVAALRPDMMKAGDALLVLGSSELSQDDAAAIELLVKSGLPALIATSPYTVSISDDWSMKKSRADALLPALRSWGFAFDNALVQDLSCFPLSMQTGTGSNVSYQTVNYSAWLSVVPQPLSPNGMTLFWASPLALYGDAVPLIVSTQSAWLQQEAPGSEVESPFITNPFLLSKTAGEAQQSPQQYVLAATTVGEADGRIHGYYERGEAAARVTVIADQYALSSLMTAYISNASSGDFRNFDVVAAELLRLRGDKELALLLQKKTDAQPLYKITDEAQFSREKIRSLVLLLGVFPLGIVAVFFYISFRRRSGLLEF